MEIVHDGRTDEWGSQDVLVKLAPDEFDAVADTLDATPEERGTYHVDHWSEPGGTHETWRDAAREAIALSDYSVLVEHVTLRRDYAAGEGDR